MKTTNETSHTLTQSLFVLASVLGLLSACDADLTATETDANDEFRAMEGDFAEDVEPCKADSDCDFGYVCEVLGSTCKGELGCVPGCRDDEDCEPGEVCTPIECFTCPCADICEPAGPICGNGELEDGEACDDGNASAADGCLPNCTIPTSCLAIHEYDAQLDDGVYAIAPEGYGGDPFAVFCDMVSDGGGYTFAKVHAGTQRNAAEAEAACATLGMQLWIPRSVAHKDRGWQIANDGGIGPDASPNYMRILGIYPEYNGATCKYQPMNSGNANCRWRASDNGPWFVHAVNSISEPNGDNNVVGSMYYVWQPNGQIQWHNDYVGNGYTSDRFMCDVADKLP